MHKVLDKFERDDYSAVEIFITPPEVSEQTDEDSGEEDRAIVIHRWPAVASNP